MPVRTLELQLELPPPHPLRGRRTMPVRTLELELELDPPPPPSPRTMTIRTLELELELAPPPGGKKKSPPSMHSRSSSERLPAVSREVRCQELIFFRNRFEPPRRYNIVTLASIQELEFSYLPLPPPRFLGCWTLGTRKLATRSPPPGWK